MQAAKLRRGVEAGNAHLLNLNLPRYPQVEQETTTAVRDGDFSYKADFLMAASLKSKLRYKVQYPLRYAADIARARFGGNAVGVCRILIASDNLAITSEQQFAPLLANRRLIGDKLGVVFDQRLMDDVLTSARPDSSNYNAVFAKLSFLTPTAGALDKIARLRRMFPPPVKLIYFDGDDDSCVQWSELVEMADLYVKKHVFADTSWYQKKFTGKNNLTDYVATVHGRLFADNVIPHSGTVPGSLVSKIFLGYNIGLDDKITNLFRDTSPATPSEKDVDVMCRAACAPDNWIYPLRGTINEALAPLTQQGHKILMPDQRVDQQTYYQEMRRSRICVSPFGYGELCWRDFEAVLMGCLLVKPDMGHIRTEPEIFIPGETYIPVRWDFSNLAETCARYLADDGARERITAHAYQVLSDYYTSFGFLKCFRKLLGQAGVGPFTGEKAATFAEARN